MAIAPYPFPHLQPEAILHLHPGAIAPKYLLKSKQILDNNREYRNKNNSNYRRN